MINIERKANRTERREEDEDEEAGDEWYTVAIVPAANNGRQAYWFRYSFKERRFSLNDHLFLVTTPVRVRC